jgi:hypothetical protein
MKNLILALALSIVLFSCTQKVTKYEYKVVEFQREDAQEFDWDNPNKSETESKKRPSFERTLNDMGEQGWEYAGVITANGINGRYIAFKRAK